MNLLKSIMGKFSDSHDGQKSKINSAVRIWEQGIFRPEGQNPAEECWLFPNKNKESQAQQLVTDLKKFGITATVKKNTHDGWVASLPIKEPQGSYLNTKEGEKLMNIGKFLLSKSYNITDDNLLEPKKRLSDKELTAITQFAATITGDRIPLGIGTNHLEFTRPHTNKMESYFANIITGFKNPNIPTQNPSNTPAQEI